MENKEEIKYEMTDEEFRKLVLDTLNASLTIEEAIKEQKENEATTKESFMMTKEICKNVKYFSTKHLLMMHYMRYRLYLLKLFTYIIQSENYDMVCDVIDKIIESEEEFKRQNKILNELKSAILKLEKNRADSCNFNICSLLMNINKKEVLLLDILNDYFKKSHLAVKGIQYFGTNENQEELTEINNNIENSIKTLGLRKITSGDKINEQ